jgi:hypothetical protein
VSAEQRETLDAILRQSAFPAGSDVSEQRRLLRELTSAQPLPAGVTVTAAALGGVPTAEITPGVPHVFQAYYVLPVGRRGPGPLTARSAWPGEAGGVTRAGSPARSV